MNKEHIAEKLLELRKEKKISQAKLARDLGLNQSSIAMYENAQRIPSDEIKVKISNYFNVPVTFFYD